MCWWGAGISGWWTISIDHSDAYQTRSIWFLASKQKLLCQHVYQSKTTDKKTFDEVEVSLVHSPVKPTLARELAREHGSFEDVYFSCIEHGDVPLGLVPWPYMANHRAPTNLQKRLRSRLAECARANRRCFVCFFPIWRSWSYVMFKVRHITGRGVPWGSSDFWIRISNLKRIAHWKHTNASISHFDPNEPPKISQTIWHLSNIPKSSGNNFSVDIITHYPY